MTGPALGGVIRVLLADDHAILRKSMSLLLASRGDVEVVGECSDGREAVDLAVELRPDIVLMDIAMPHLNGIEATEMIRRQAPGVRVIMLSNYGSRETVRDAVRAGASAFVLKRSDVDELILALWSVRRRNFYFSAALAESFDMEQVVREARSPQTSPRDALSPREREVVQLFAEGHTARSIAELLGLSEKTVESHRAHVRLKIGARTRMDLLKFALSSGLAVLDSPDSYANPEVGRPDDESANTVHAAPPGDRSALSARPAGHELPVASRVGSRSPGSRKLDGRERAD